MIDKIKMIELINLSRLVSFLNLKQSNENPITKHNRPTKKNGSIKGSRKSTRLN